jgi:hypothetical protein
VEEDLRDVAMPSPPSSAKLVSFLGGFWLFFPRFLVLFLIRFVLYWFVICSFLLKMLFYVCAC